MSAAVDYLAYQERYRDVPRESDRVTINLVAEHAPQGGRLLDVGCSTGNLLLHLAKVCPDLQLVGCDSDLDAVKAAQNTKAVPLVFCADIVHYTPVGLEQSFDVVTASAVFYCLDDDGFAVALRNIAVMLKPGGVLIVWDLFHRWEQKLVIHESSERYGDHRLTIRPFSLVEREAAAAGFDRCEFRRFKPPYMDSPRDPSDLTSWTLWSRNIAFRGGLVQPWCHAVLTKP